MKWLAVVILSAVSYSAFGTEIIFSEKIVIASGLAGIVTDSTGAALAGVEIELVGCPRADWGSRESHTVFNTVKTNTMGRFWISTHRKSRLYCLRFEDDGFNILQIRVKVSPSGRELRVGLTPAA